MSQGSDSQSSERRFFGLPATWVGWLAIGLDVLATLGIFARRWTGGFRGIFAGWIIAGTVALAAVAWQKERSVLVWAVLVFGTLAALWMGAEILFPH